MALPVAAQQATAPASGTPATVVQTKPGAMVSRIAAAHRPAGATVDQMLLAILKANPDAFMADNINLLKKGAALTMPASADVLATPAADARRLILQQHADYEKHGYKLVTMAGSTTPGMAASGAEAGTPSPQSPAVAPSAAASAGAAPASVGSSAVPSALAASAASTPDAVPTAASAAAPAAPGSQALPPVSAPPAPVPASAGINPMVWIAAGGALLLVIVAWLMMRVRRMREEDRLAAEAAAAEPRAAAEALARVWDVDHQEDSDAAAGSTTGATPTAAAPADASRSHATPPADATGPEAATAEIDGLTLDLSTLEQAGEPAAPAVAPRTFDFSSINLELEDPVDTAVSAEALQTRLDLAREFLAIRDFDGARTLAQEVLDKADDALQVQARQLLADIDAAESH